MWINENLDLIDDDAQYVTSEGTVYPWNFPKNEIPGLSKITVVVPTVGTNQEAVRDGVESDGEGGWKEKWLVTDIDPVLIAQNLTDAKFRKDLEINQWREDANLTFFMHQGKAIVCDKLSRSDIDAIAISISMAGVLPPSFPGGWLALDKSFIPIPDAAGFKDFFASMIAQGTMNFNKSVALKESLALCETIEAVNLLRWN